MGDGYHPPREEYLETIYTLEEQGIPVIQARLVERLGKTAPSVSEMLARLEEEGLVVRPGRVVALTDAGRKLAESVVRRHRLAERLLVDVIGLEWHKAHMEAGRWEHVISEDVEERLVALLGNPATCPHGNPIPGGPQPSTGELISIGEASVGSDLRLVRIGEEIELDPGALEFLENSKLMPGAQCQVSSRTQSGQIRLGVGNEQVSLEPELTRYLFVEVAR